MWYFDDATLGSTARSDITDICKCVTELKKIGLEVNPSKCEIINMSYPVDEFTELVTTLAQDLPGLKRTECADIELLGSVILDQVVKKAIANKFHTYHLTTHRLHQLDTHMGYFLLKNAFSLHRFLSARPHSSIILTTPHPMNNTPVRQQSRSAMSSRRYRLEARETTCPFWRPRTSVWR